MQGFTLVEALIAGVLMTFVIASVGRLSLAALASSGNQKERTELKEPLKIVSRISSILTHKQQKRVFLKTTCEETIQITHALAGAYLAHRLAYGITLEDDWINVSTRGSEALTFPYGVNSLRIFYVQPNSTNLDSLSIKKDGKETKSKGKPYQLLATPSE